MRAISFRNRSNSVDSFPIHTNSKQTWNFPYFVFVIWFVLREFDAVVLPFALDKLINTEMFVDNPNKQTKLKPLTVSGHILMNIFPVVVLSQFDRVAYAAYINGLVKIMRRRPFFEEPNALANNRLFSPDSRTVRIGQVFF